MSWLFDLRLYRSPRNGFIWCRRLLGQWTVYVDGIMQTSPYVTHMWQDALARLPADARPRRLLLLGLGAGGIVPTLRGRWPDAELVAVEWDEAMVQLASRLGIYGVVTPPRVELGDAHEVVPHLAGEFDLVMFDLFTSGQPAVTPADDAFLAALAARTASGGYLIANVFCHVRLFAAFTRHFRPVTDWTWKYNRLGLFRRV